MFYGHYAFVQLFSFFFLTATATTEIYTLSLHDALPISILMVAAYVGYKVAGVAGAAVAAGAAFLPSFVMMLDGRKDRKSTRLNSSHRCISYAVFCLKKKKNKYTVRTK